MKTPRYYCESCGAEVRSTAKVCPRCGRFFSSVKCPKCRYAGQPDDFAAGCPICGYADAMNDAPEPLRPPPPPPRGLPIWAWLAGLVFFILMLFFLLRALR